MSEKTVNSVEINVGKGVSLRVNFLSLVSIFVGALAVSVPWFSINSVFDTPDYVPLEALMNGRWHSEALLWMSSLLFLVGVVCMLVSPLGGTFQAAGLVPFFVYFVSRFHGWDPYFEDTLILGFGPYLGFVSACVAIASLIMPLGFNTEPCTRFSERFLTFKPRIGVGGSPLSSHSGPRKIGETVGALFLVAGVGAFIYGLVAPMARAGTGSNIPLSVLVPYTLMALWGSILAGVGVVVMLLTLRWYPLQRLVPAAEPPLVAEGESP
jgi:hypothetical protein